MAEEVAPQSANADEEGADLMGGDDPKGDDDVMGDEDSPEGDNVMAPGRPASSD